MFERDFFQPNPSFFGLPRGADLETPQEGSGVFEAVHSGTPHWYLSEETTGGLFRPGGPFLCVWII